jgi:tRNA A-37 threonylcarbamoyl transferase component Bud32
MRMLDVRVGSYRITERLARGGMGEVYLARHEIMDREAAVKLIHPELTDKRDLVDRFLNEARAAASIRHPGIVEVFDVGQVDGRAYIVMEYLRGELLASRLARTRIDLDKALLLTRQIAGALGAAHACGIIHRDLKPENIFIVPDPDVVGGERTKILDFGIAKLLESQGVVHTVQGAMFGTPAYMAPEQCQDAAQVDRRADLYSLGCIMYELLTGTPPFGRGGMELIAAHLRDHPPPLRDRAPRVSPALESIVMGLLAKNPDERFQSCEALIRALDHVQAEESAAAASPAGTDGPGAAALLPSSASDRASGNAASGSAAHAATPNPHAPVAVARATLPEADIADTAVPHGRASAFDAATQPGPLSVVGIPESTVQAAGSLHEHGGAATAAPARTRWLPGLAALVLLVLGAGVFWGGSWLWPRSPAEVPVAVTADAGIDARTLLDRARRALDDRAWDDARALVREAIALAGEDAALRAEGETLRQRAEEEQTNSHAFRLFERALGERDMILAAKHYRELSARSVYRVDATALIERMRDEWFAAQVAQAERLADDKQCRKVGDLEADLVQVADVFEIDVEPIQELHKKCRTQRRQDESSPKPEEPTGKLPARIELRLQKQLQHCAQQHGVHGDVAVRVQVSAQATIEKIAVEPAREPFEGCVRARMPRRLVATPGAYRVTAKIP